MNQIMFNLKHLDILASTTLPAFFNDYKKDFDLEKVARNERRRLSNCAKSMFTLVKDFDLNNLNISYCSNKGEINSCILMLKELSKDNTVSPMSFSNSVLNASSSRLCIHYQNHNNISTISSKYIKDLFINSTLMLDDKDTALFFYHEDLYELFNKENKFICFFAIITKGNEIKVNLEYKNDDIYTQISHIINGNWSLI